MKRLAFLLWKYSKLHFGTIERTLKWPTTQMTVYITNQCLPFIRWLYMIFERNTLTFITSNFSDVFECWTFPRKLLTIAYCSYLGTCNSLEAYTRVVLRNSVLFNSVVRPFVRLTIKMVDFDGTATTSEAYFVMWSPAKIGISAGFLPALIVWESHPPSQKYASSIKCPVVAFQWLQQLAR